MVQPRKIEAKRGDAQSWTKERIEQLGKVDVQQLQANAERLGEPELAALCAGILKDRPRVVTTAASRAKARTQARSLMSRSKAFEARGVWLTDSRTSWSGVRKIDGVVVVTLWASAIQSASGSCSYLLWAPNVDGNRPWSDKPAGKERLEHCKLAIENGGAEGLLAYGEPLEGHVPEDKARTVLGLDPETVLRVKVEKRGQEYWATWGKKVTT
jgi:hypothetical protein